MSEAASWQEQGVVLAAIGLLSWSYRIEPHPFAIMLRRFGIVAAATWALLTAALASAGRSGESAIPANIANITFLTDAAAKSGAVCLDGSPAN